GSATFSQRALLARSSMRSSATIRNDQGWDSWIDSALSATRSSRKTLELSANGTSMAYLGQSSGLTRRYLSLNPPPAGHRHRHKGCRSPAVRDYWPVQ